MIARSRIPMRLGRFGSGRPVALSTSITGIRVEKLPGLVLVQDRRLAFLHDVLRPADGLCRVRGDDLANDKPVKEHPDGREVLLDRRGLVALAQLFDVGRDVVAPDVLQGEPAGLAPDEEPTGVPVVGGPRVLVPDVVGEEGEEPLGGFRAVGGDHRRDGGVAVRSTVAGSVVVVASEVGLVRKFMGGSAPLLRLF